MRGVNPAGWNPGRSNPSAPYDGMRRGVVAITALLALVAAIGEISAHGDDAHEAPEAAAVASSMVHVAKEQQFALGVLTEPAASRALGVGVGTTGRVVPRTDAVADVLPPIAGRVTGGGLPRLGDHVRRGQVLFRVVQVLTPGERTALRTEVIKARAELDAAKREAERVERLEGVVPDKQRAEAKNRLTAARDTYDALSAQMAGNATSIAATAPISGTIVAAEIAEGEVVDGARVAYRIADLSNVWVEADVFERDIARVQGARTAEITTAAYPGGKFIGTLYRIAGAVDPASRTIKALFVVQNRDERLKLNMSADVAVKLGADAVVPAIPESAVVRSGARTLVFVHHTPEEFEVRDVRLGGGRGGGYVEVRAGIEPGDRVVVAGAYQMKALAGL